MTQAVTVESARRSALSLSTAALVSVTMLAAVLRFADLGSQSFWAEEAVTRSLVRLPLVEMWRTIPHSESTPPLYYTLAWLWTHVFGTSEVGLRSLSALVGTATVPVAYLAARTLVGRTLPALAVAAWVAVSPIFVWYSQESRSYGLYAFFGALSVLMMARALAAPGRASRWGWAAAAAAAMATHYCAGFLVLGEAAVLLVRLRRAAIWPVAAATAVGAALAPLAKYQHDHISAFQGINSEPVHTRLWEVAQRWPFVSYNPGHNLSLAVVWIAVTVLVARGYPRRAVVAALVPAVTAVFVPVVLATGRAYDVFTFRNVLSGWIPLAIAVAAGLPRGRAGVAMIAAGCLVLLAPTLAIATKPSLQRDSWRTAIARVRALPPAERVLASEDYFTPPQYWPGLALREQPVRAREVDYVSRYATAATRFPALRGFRLAGFTAAGNMGIVRYVASSARTVRPDELPPGVRLIAPR